MASIYHKAAEAESAAARAEGPPASLLRAPSRVSSLCPSPSQPLARLAAARHTGRPTSGPGGPASGPGGPASGHGGAERGRGVESLDRLAALRATGLLDSATEPAFDRLTRLASKLLDAPIAAVSLVDEQRQFFKSAVGLGEPWASRRETPLSHSLCRHVVEREYPLVVGNAAEHPLVSGSLAVTELGVASYLGVPLMTSSGYVLGALCVADGKQREWSGDGVELMYEIAAFVMTEIELRGALCEAKGRAAEAERAEAALRESEERYRLLADNSSDLVCAFRPDGSRAYVSPSCERLLGYIPAELAAMPLGGVLSKSDRVRLRRHFEQAVASGDGGPPLLHRVRTKGGERRWFETNVQPVHDRRGAISLVHCSSRDVTRRKHSEVALARQTAFVELLRATATEANAATTFEAALRACVSRVCHHMGWPVGHVYAAERTASGVELAPTDFWHLSDDERFATFCAVTRTVRLSPGAGLPGRVLAEGKAHWMVDVREDPHFVRRAAARASNLHAGLAFPVLVGDEVVAVLEFYSERSEEPDGPLLEVMANLGLQLGRVVERERARAALEQHAAEIQALSNSDELTGLFNRRGFLALAAPKLGRAPRGALLFFADLNGMKQINDAFGHDVGDDALRATARLLRATFRESDVLARLGGDEFVALVSDAETGLIDTLRARLDAKIEADNAAGERPFQLSVSLGAAIYDRARPQSLEALLAEADALMYEQKRRRKRAREGG